MWECVALLAALDSGSNVDECCAALLGGGWGIKKKDFRRCIPTSHCVSMSGVSGTVS